MSPPRSPPPKSLSQADLDRYLGAFQSPDRTQEDSPPAARVYSPWTEPPEALESRHVGREDVLDLLEQGLERLARGERQLPLYLFGPRGIGKSHMVTLSAARVSSRAPGIRVLHLPEDLPPPTSADELWGWMVPALDLPAWLTWNTAWPRLSGRATVVFVEGLDRHLDALGEPGRKRLRALLDEHPEVWVVGTGARLTAPFTDHSEAFYGGFVALPLRALSDEEAAWLLDHQAGEVAQAHPRWAARRAALVTLAGGSPRAVVALADAVGAAPGDEVARRLLYVLDAFTPNYQLRVRDLNASEQRLVNLLTKSPRELGPTDVAAFLGGTPSTWSTTAHRLAEHGVLVIRQEGRAAWYRILEPLFRYWLEYRTSPPEQTRVAWLSQLLERVLGPDEMVAVWTRSEDLSVRAAALEAVRRRPEARKMAWDDRAAAVAEALDGGDERQLRARVTEAVQVGPSADQAWSLVVTLVRQSEALGVLLAPALSRGGCPNLAGLVRSLEVKVDVRGFLRGLIAEGQREFARAGLLEPVSAQASGAALNLLLDRAIGRMDRRGSVWRISEDEAATLARLPWLRARFYRQGRLPGHPPLLGPGHLLAVSLGADDPDLPDLLWLSMVRTDRQLAPRLLGLIEHAAAPRLPWCPWPGRLLFLDPEAIARVAARWAAREAVLWAGALTAAANETFSAFVARLAEVQPTPPPLRTASSYELSLGRLSMWNPERLDALRESLGAPWSALFVRVEVLVRQLSEGERGPLHPELARVRSVLLSDERM